MSSSPNPPAAAAIVKPEFEQVPSAPGHDSDKSNRSAPAQRHVGLPQPAVDGDGDDDNNAEVKVEVGEAEAGVEVDGGDRSRTDSSSSPGKGKGIKKEQEQEQEEEGEGERGEKGEESGAKNQVVVRTARVVVDQGEPDDSDEEGDQEASGATEIEDGDILVDFPDDTHVRLSILKFIPERLPPRVLSAHPARRFFII